jgi:hypothetical protein
MRLKPLLFGLALVGLTAFTVRELRDEFRSDEQRIHDTLMDAVDGFNDQRLRRVLVVFAKDFRDETQGFDREKLKGGLVYLFFQESRHWATLREEQLNINLDAEAGTATVALGLEILREREGEYVPWWDLRAVVDMQRQNGKKWRIVASRDVNHNERER